MDRVGLIPGPSDLGIPAATDTELREGFARLSILGFAPWLGRLNTALALDSGDLGLQQVLAQALLPPSILARLSVWVGQNRDRNPLWLGTAQIRIALKLLLECGSTDGGFWPQHDEAKLLIGVALLSATETYRSACDLGPQPPGSEGWLHTLLQFNHTADLDTGRPYDVLAHKENVYRTAFSNAELRERFQANYACSPDELHRGLMGLWVWFSQQDAKKLRHTMQHAVDHRMLFGRFEVPFAAGSLLLGELAHDLRMRSSDTLPKGTGAWADDLSSLVRKPLGLMDDNVVCCLDFKFLQSAYGRLVYNLTRRMLSAKEANRLVSQVGGTVFEDQCRRLLAFISEERSPKGAAVWTPLRAKGLEVDAVVAEEHEVVLMEFKAAVLPPELLYGTSVHDLADRIDRDFVRGKGERDPKGFGQLAGAARRILGDPGLVNLKRIKRIHPVLVVVDDTIPFKPALNYVIDEARKELCGIHYTVQAPVVLHVEDLALLAERSRKFQVTYMFRRMWRSGLNGVFCFRDLILRDLSI